jgi:ribonuclease HI
MPPMSSRKPVAIYADGACLGNPGPGGFGVVLLFGAHRRELSGGYRRTTNNRMELLGAVRGLEALKEPCTVTLHSDSIYVIKAMRERWPQGWAAKGWRKADKKPVANQDLWEQMLALAEGHAVTWKWVKGHAGDRENERCDALANAAARGADLAVDAAYEGLGSKADR